MLEEIYPSLLSIVHEDYTVVYISQCNEIIHLYKYCNPKNQDKIDILIYNNTHCKRNILTTYEPAVSINSCVSGIEKCIFIKKNIVSVFKMFFYN